MRIVIVLFVFVLTACSVNVPTMSRSTFDGLTPIFNDPAQERLYGATYVTHFKNTRCREAYENQPKEPGVDTSNHWIVHMLYSNECIVLNPEQSGHNALFKLEHSLLIHMYGISKDTNNKVLYVYTDVQTVASD